MDKTNINIKKPNLDVVIEADENKDIDFAISILQQLKDKEKEEEIPKPMSFIVDSKGNSGDKLTNKAIQNVIMADELDKGIIMGLIKGNPGERIGDLFKDYQEKGGKSSYKTFTRRIEVLDNHKLILTEKMINEDGNTTLVKDPEKHKKRTKEEMNKDYDKAYKMYRGGVSLAKSFRDVFYKGGKADIDKFVLWIKDNHLKFRQVDLKRYKSVLRGVIEMPDLNANKLVEYQEPKDTDILLEAPDDILEEKSEYKVCGFRNKYKRKVGVPDGKYGTIRSE